MEPIDHQCRSEQTETDARPIRAAPQWRTTGCFGRPDKHVPSFAGRRFVCGVLALLEPRVRLLPGAIYFCAPQKVFAIDCGPGHHICCLRRATRCCYYGNSRQHGTHIYTLVFSAGNGRGDWKHTAYRLFKICLARSRIHQPGLYQHVPACCPYFSNIGPPNPQKKKAVAKRGHQDRRRN